jgi:hypothetical protein
MIYLLKKVEFKDKVKAFYTLIHVRSHLLSNDSNSGKVEKIREDNKTESLYISEQLKKYKISIEKLDNYLDGLCESIKSDFLVEKLSGYQSFKTYQDIKKVIKIVVKKQLFVQCQEVMTRKNNNLPLGNSLVLEKYINENKSLFINSDENYGENKSTKHNTDNIKNPKNPIRFNQCIFPCLPQNHIFIPMSCKDINSINQNAQFFDSNIINYYYPLQGMNVLFNLNNDGY